jgi:hypothetical protein
MIWSRLLDELLRRARPPAASHLAERWTAWARRLAEGRARTDAAGAGAGMTLLALARHGAQRASRLEQRLQLAVRVLHQRTGSAADGSPGRSLAGRDPGATRAVVVSAGRDVAGEGLGVPVPIVLRPPAAPQPHGPAQLQVERPPAAAVGIAGQETAQRVVEQLRRVEEPVYGSRARSAAAMHAVAGGARAAGTSGVDPQTGWALPVPGAPARLLVRQGAAAGAGAPGANGADAGAERRPAADARAPEPLDIERLADRVVRQIDRRIVAQRERVGRI